MQAAPRQVLPHRRPALLTWHAVHAPRLSSLPKRSTDAAASGRDVRARLRGARRVPAQKTYTNGARAARAAHLVYAP